MDESKPLLDAAAGGLARAKKLSPTERSRIARAAAEERWLREGKTLLPKAIKAGPLRIGDIEFDVAVLDDKERTRVVSETRFMAAMGMYRSGAVSTRRAQPDEGGARTPLFIAHKNLKPYVERHLSDLQFSPLKYRTMEGGVASVGIPAAMIPKVCEVWIDADRDGVLGPRQKLVARNADILLRGLAHVGIIALVDEATGFQDDRPRDALARILEAFVAKELRKWVRSFPPDFYKEMFRLRGLPYDGSVKRPAYIGHLTNDLVYSRLAPGVLNELRAKNPANTDGRRKHKHHQWLSEDVGHPKLQQHLASVVALMKATDDWDSFKRLLDRALKPYTKLPLLRDLDE
jgi:hypothetical protein